MPTTSFWDNRYDREDLVFGTEPNAWIHANESQLSRHSRVLCLGEGEGRNAVFLARRGHSVTAVDLSAVGLTKAQKFARDAAVSIQTIVADLAEFDLGTECWDAVIAVFCHLPPGIREAVHAKTARALAPGGLVLMETYSPRQLQFGTGGPKDPSMLYEPKQLSDDFPGLAIECCEELQREIHEGIAHNGPSAVVRFRARKPNN